MDVLLYLLLSAGAVLTIRQLPRIWKGDALPSIARNLGATWPFGRPLLCGTIRAIPVAVIGFCALLIAAIAGALFGPLDAVATLEGLVVAIYVVSVAGVLVCVALMITITLLNKPHRAVPPALRHQAGSLDEWRGH